MRRNGRGQPPPVAGQERRRSTTVIVTGNSKLDAVARASLDVTDTSLDPRKKRAPLLLPEDAVVLAGWLTNARVRKSLTSLDLSGNISLVGRRNAGEELHYSGKPFEGGVAEKVLTSGHTLDPRHAGANAAMLTDKDWVDDGGGSWSEARRKQAVAAGVLRWACISCAPQAWATEPGTGISARPWGLATNMDWRCHWVLGMHALAAACSTLRELRVLRLRGIGLGPRGCEILARRGLGTELRELDLAENPLLGLDWQGAEHAADAGTAFGGLCRRVLGVGLAVGWHGLREGAPEPHESVGLGATRLLLQHTNVG
eukprot:SAG25_NODE_580_length_6767_cov_20.692412_3_plen_314_part_00